jgi:GTP-binding protein
VYTKADKLSGNARRKNAAALDAGHGIKSGDRVIFSAKSRVGRDEILEKINYYIEIA